MMAQPNIESGKLQSKEQMQKNMSGNDIEGAEMLSVAETPAERVSKEEVLTTPRRGNIDRGPRSVAEADRTSLLELFRAAFKGNWRDACRILRGNEHAKTAKIPSLGSTALHVAADYGRSEFVVEFVKILSAEQLEVRDDQNGRTALHCVAEAANVVAAKAMVEKNPNLPHLGDKDNLTPLFYAAKRRLQFERRKMVEYLYQVTEDKGPCYPFTGDSAADLVVAMTASGSYDTALRMLKRYPELALQKNFERRSILDALAMQPLAFRSGYQLSTWESFIYKLGQVDMEETEHEYKHSRIDVAKSKNLRDAAALFFKFMSKFDAGIRKVSKIQQSQRQALGLVEFVIGQLKREDIVDVWEYLISSNDYPTLFLAIEHGVFELVLECLNHFPDLVWCFEIKTNRSLFDKTVEVRRVEIFNHVVALMGNNTQASSRSTFELENNILHLAAKLAPTPQLTSVPGPAFQMQREFQWFKAVEAIVYDGFRTQMNGKGQTPRELFSDAHQDLLKNAKEWMDKTSNSCMVVAALVATVSFAAVITVPGGNDNATGIAVLGRKKLFMIFLVLNAISLTYSAASLLMFLLLQTSRYTEEDFLESLPQNFVRGLVVLFIAVVTMMMSFGAAIGLSLQSRINWAHIATFIVACFPAIILTRLHLPLLLQPAAFLSGPAIFRGQRKIDYRLLETDMA